MRKGVISSGVAGMSCTWSVKLPTDPEEGDGHCTAVVLIAVRNVKDDSPDSTFVKRQIPPPSPGNTKPSPKTSRLTELVDGAPDTEIELTCES